MRFEKLALVIAAVAMPLFSQTDVTLNLTGNAFLTAGTGYGFNGTATLSGLGTAVLSGAGTLDSLLSGQSSGAVLGTFTLVFPGGEALYGTVAIPAGYLVPQVGGTAIATGAIVITGGTGKFEGTRGVFSPITGSGTATGPTTTNFVINGSGQLSIARKILPQIAFGGGWYTALYFTNSSNVQASFTVNFVADDGTPLNTPGGSASPVNLGPGASARLELPNTGTLSQGYAAMTLPEGVTGYGVFRQSVAGIADQEAVVPLVNAAATVSTLIFDDTNFITAASIVNTSTVEATITITAKSANGGLLGTATVTLDPKKKKAIALRSVPGLAGIANSRGTVTFTVTPGRIAVLGLRFYGSAFTSIPATDTLVLF